MSRSGRWRQRLITFGRCVLAGVTICLSIPPFGWWPLAFLGIFQWDRLLAEQPWAARLRRTVLITLAWLAPSMLWMLDLTPPGYVLAMVFFALFFGIFAALVPPHAVGRWIALPGAIVVAELWR